MNKKNEIIAKLNTINLDNISVENVRCILNISQRFAKFICDYAVKLDYFKKIYNISCPNNHCQRIIRRSYNENETQFEINCEVCELLESDKYNFEKKDCKLSVTYEFVR